MIPGESTRGIPLSDGFSLFSRLWKSTGEAKSVIVCLPGTGGNCEFFRPVGLDLAGLGNRVYGLDLRGFGNSVEKGLERGDTSSFKRHLQDLVEAVRYIRQEIPARKLYVFGYSHGCAYALWLGANHASLLDGLILAAPPVLATSRVQRSSYLKFALALIFAPKTMYSFDTSKGEDQPGSPLETKRLSIRWLYGSKKYLLDKLFQNASLSQLPVLVLQGDADKTTLAEGAQTLLKTLGTDDKSIQVFPGADHFFYGALFYDLEFGNPDRKHEVATVINDWLALHSSSQTHMQRGSPE